MSSLFPSSPQRQDATLNVNYIQDRPHSSSGRGGRGRRKHHQHRQKTPSDQHQSTAQHVLHFGNLLRRLLPSSAQFSSGSHTSWTHTCSNTKLWWSAKLLLGKQFTWEKCYWAWSGIENYRNIVLKGPAGRKPAWQHVDECQRKHRLSRMQLAGKKLRDYLPFRSSLFCITRGFVRINTC